MNEILPLFTSPAAWLALLTLIFLELVLGIDNVVFISVESTRLPTRQQTRARITGLLTAMAGRIGLLLGVSLLMQLDRPIFAFSTSWASGAVSWQGLIVFAGGLFLLWKSISEMHHKLEKGVARTPRHASHVSFWGVIAQVTVLDIVFSMDSVLTAVGMIDFRAFGYGGAMAIMITAIVVSVVGMIFFSGAISRMIQRYPTIQMLAISFLLLIAVLLLMEGAHLTQLTLFGTTVPAIPRGYIYFAIAFSLMVEVLNIRMSNKRRSRKQ